MPLICVHSPKGGVGKTSISANLCYALSRIGMKVLAIDFDVQNALRLHFGVPLSDTHGYAAKTSTNPDWSQYVLNTGNTGSTFILPYGKVTEEQHLAFENHLANDDVFLSRGLNTLLNYPGLVIIADLPSGPALKAVISRADLQLVPLLADTASLSTLPRVENQHFINLTTHQQVPRYFLINQTDVRRQISRDIQAFMEERLGDELLGEIHRDESVIEANAAQKSIFDFNPASAAAFDIEIISKKVASILGIQVGDGTLHASPSPYHF